VYGTKNRLTRVTVTLDRKGKLRAIVISKKSGVDVLDQEAVSAFRLAQPFPNPPRGLIDPRTGLIVFQFGFHFDVHRRAAWKIYRHR
jgi:TonB family protein